MSSRDNEPTPKDISGNVSEELKQAVLDLHEKINRKEKTGFAAEILRRFRIVSVDLEPMLVTNKKQAVVVSEIEVTQGEKFDVNREGNNSMLSPQTCAMNGQLCMEGAPLPFWTG